MECGRLCAERKLFYISQVLRLLSTIISLTAQTPVSHLYRLWILVLMRKLSLLAPTVIMKLST
jgi:hypothetical protein